MGHHRLAAVGIALLGAAIITLGPGAAHAASALTLDSPVEGSPEGERFVEAGDALEAEKLLQMDPEEIAFRNGLRLRPKPGLDPSAPKGLHGIALLQFGDRIRREWIDRLAELDVVVHDHVQGTVLLAEVPETAWPGIEEMLGQGILRHVGAYPPEAKVDVSLRQGPASRRRVTVILFEGFDPAAESSLRKILPVEPSLARPGLSLTALASAGDVEAIARLEAVRWIEPYVPGSVNNLEAAMSGGADYVAGGGLYTGAGVRVAVDDTGITRTGSAAECGAASTAYHPDIAQARIADEYDFQNGDAIACDDAGHGTHVAGTVGGDGTLWSDWRGIAPDVTYLIYKDADANGHGFGHFDQVLSRAASHDADVVANSWGGGTGGYNLSAFQADQAVRGGFNGSDGQPQRMFVSVSVGNDNNLVTSPATGKNVVAVGAMKDGNAPGTQWCWSVDNCGGLPGCGCSPTPRCGDRYAPASERICFSNTGPVDTDADGQVRIKPDVVAPGTRITSLAAPHLRPGQGFYVAADGTSMAQPVVAGIAAQMIDAIPALRDWPELMKARMLGTAVSLGPTALYGHGMVDALHSVFSTATLQSVLWEGNTLTGTGAERDHTFTVPPGASEVRVYVTWSDPESATTETVNDIDLRVYDGSGALVASSASYDDTVEYARITTGAPGTWRANVRGFNIPQPDARYGIFAATVQDPGLLSMELWPDNMCVKPGALIQVETTLSATGHSAVASETVLDLPDDPSLITLSNVTMYSVESGRDHTYQAAEIRREAVPNEYFLYQGLIHPLAARHAYWRLQVPPSTAEGSYSISARGTAAGHIPYADYMPIEVDATTPSNAANLVSTTHPAGTCWLQSYVWMSWEPALDVGCGVDGYAFSWTTGAPALPAAVKQLEESDGVYFEPLPDSTAPYYFNLRTVDNAGNWAAGYASYGPMWVDTTPPGNVAMLDSATNPAWTCSTDNPVQMSWSAAPDDNCGLAGYSVSWSVDTPALPDTVPDLGPVTSYGESLVPSNDVLYFNIRSVDVAGNWAPGYEYHGPFIVDSPSAPITGLDLTISGQDLNFFWNPETTADSYRIYADTDPRFLSRVPVATDVTGVEYWETGGALRPGGIVYYQVFGANICGTEGS